MESPSVADPLVLEDFGQKVDLTRRIREVLLNYPEGTTVLKELIQNADDAGATRVRLCLDRRVHPSASLLSDKLAQWQGPALLAYNDAQFTEEDFVSISRIGGSNKHGQAWKTGRFGVGFNSVYHITDLPSFVSGKYVVLFDPQGVYLPNVSMANPGKRIDFVTSSAISFYEDQFLPYCAFGCNMKVPFPGTLFRFPLRNEDQAASSKLSKQVYLEEDISSMFVQLYEEGVFTLLFLKNVLSVEMYIWDVGVPAPRKIYSCSINSVNDDTVWHRQTLLRLSKSINFSDPVIDAFTLDFLSEAVIDSHSQKRVDTFYIVQKMASPTSRIGALAATASKDYDIHLLPWASVAACISDNSSHDEILKLGRAFCFLPLPVQTGMTVHVNGYFEVSSNRRGIWYGDDMDRSGKIRSLWNRFLLEDVVAPTFAQLLLGVQRLLGPTKFYYSLCPSGSFEEPWSVLVEHIYRNISDVPVLYSDLEGGQWVSPMEAFLHDEEFSNSKQLGEALVELGMPVVHVPKVLFDMLLKSSSGFQQKVVTSDSVRHYLRECRSLISLSRSYKLVLLEYCLEDLLDADVSTHAFNLPLVPLANGNFGLFSEGSTGLCYFICNESEYKLLQRVSDRIIDHNIPCNLFGRLSAVAKASNSNLIVFNVNYFLQIFSKFVPADWKYKSKVVWDPMSNSNHPTSPWFMLLWQYLRDRCEKLSLFGDWPIIPSLSGHLHRPSLQSKLLNVERLSEKMKDVLIKMGCSILDNSYGVEHPELSYYVNDADAAGVLVSIFDVVSSGNSISQMFHYVKMEERDELRHFLLDPKWYIGNHMTNSDIWSCKKLPIFRVYGGQSAQTIQYSDLENPPKYLPPSDVPKSFLDVEFVCSSSNSEEEVLNKYYGIKQMRKASFYKQHVLHRVGTLQPEVRDGVMLSVLQELPQLCIEDASLREYLRTLDFVPTSSGLLKSPPNLYDPRIEELYALLEDSDSFPSGIFQEPGILDMLQGLGLRMTVSLETVIHSARQVEQLMHEDQQRAYSRGKVLLSYLEVNALKWLPNPPNADKGTMNRVLSRATTALRPRNLKSDTERFWNDLRMISWCPVLISPPYQALPWPAVSSMVAPPKLVRLYTDLWLVSASMRILDGECSSTALSQQLGWSSPPGGSVIAAQLLELGKNNEIVTDQVFRQELALAMPRIYTILMGIVGSDEMDVVKAVLEGCRWIWVGDGFVTSDEVVLNGPLHLAPYIRVIPVDLAAFRDLFLGLGIREFLKPSDYAHILSRMAMRKDSTPLDAQENRAALLIAQHLAEVQFDEQQIKIYLPDVSGRLILATDLVYNDAPWLLASEEPDRSFGNGTAVALSARRAVQKFVHGNISSDVAEKLGVRSLRRMLLAESADSMNLSLSGAAEAFGQHEALTTRLKHILEMYADGPGILFELVQNAEDARASEVIFLLDKTQYGTSSVLSPEMADWQGPALYCFNDSVFSPQDLYAISRIGQESKLEKPFAIGRFGLGFNSVYHFTDVPTFVSGENIVMFDPHACYLPGISPSHPGLRIKFVGREILEQFPDQFSPFLHFGCDLQHPFSGTLFRFPLRSGSVASRSQIKKESYAPEDVISLFSSFSEVVSETLLFLRNVKTISLFVKEGASSEMQLLHRVSKYSVNDPDAEASKLHNSFSLMYGNQQDGVDKDQLLNNVSQSGNTVLSWKCQKIVVREQNPSGSRSHLWVTSECLGSDRSMSKSANTDKKSNKFTPWASVASYVHSMKIDPESSGVPISEEPYIITPDIIQVPFTSVQDRKTFEGRAFCFLPLPISTGLPVHVNAYFELSSNRRDIWFGNDMAGGGKKRSDWNIYLLEDVVAPAYGHLLEKVAFEIGPCDLFFSFWPTMIGLEPWASMVRKLYLFIADFGLRVLYTKARGGQWISTKQAIFPDFTFHKVNELVVALSEAGLPIVTVSKPVVEKFMEFCPFLHFLTPQLLRPLLIRRKREFMDRDSMILTLEYCLHDITVASQRDSLCGLPLLPLSNGLFTTFEKRGVGERIYIACGDEYGLLKDSVPHQLVDAGIPDTLQEKLCDLARSEDFNMSFLTCHLLEKLFLRLLPPEWKHAKQVTWAPGLQGQPSLEWMRLLWSYLKSSCDDLSIFSKWPILPVGNNYLLQLVENSNLIEDDGWSENMSSLLVRVGCAILRSDFVIDHAQLKLYVQPPTLSGVLNALVAVAGTPEKIEGLFKEASEGELHELRSFILQSKWFNEDSMDSMHIDIIKHLPVFETFRNRKLVCLSKPTKLLKPAGIREDLLDDNFVRAESDKERIILRNYLGISEPPRADFYKDYVLNRMPEFVSHQESLLTILRDVKLLIKEDSSINAALSATAFVLANNGSWKEPSRLYDPRIPELQKVLHREVFFPAEQFSDPETLETLVNLGLRQNLDFRGLLDCARSVSILNELNDSEAVHYGRRLLVFFDAIAFHLSAQEDQGNHDVLGTVLGCQNSNVDGEAEMYVPEISENCFQDELDIDSFIGNLMGDKPGEEFWSELKAIAWCPVYTSPPLQGLPWLVSERLVAAPVNVRPKSQMWMVSSKMNIVDGECRSTYLQHKLGWLDLPSIDVLSTQLIGLSMSYTQLKSCSMVEPGFDSALQKELPLLYLKLKEYVGVDDFMILKSALNGVSWVWVGDDFVSPNALAFDSPVKFSPYLYVVPSELSEFRDLLLALGVRPSFDALDYLRVLRQLQVDVKGSGLTSDQLNFVTCVLEAVADCYSNEPSFEVSDTPLLIPDSFGILRSVVDLVYNDAPWMENTVVGKHFVHPSINNDLAIRLGVQSLRCLSLVSEEMTKDLPCMDYARVSELLELHGNRGFLLFDLLELADCCKAKKFHLIFDKREHPRQSLLQHNLGEYQGPALLAVLEGVSLSREELSNLQFLPPWRLRGDTLNYGLGLLSCFYVCDLPSVLSGGHLYMFDPRGLAFAVPSCSGPAAKMFSLIGTNLTEQFRDQFNPLLVGQGMPWSSSESTVIRMPLSSELMKDGLECGLKRIQQIFEKFMEQGSRILLFLKSVLQVTLSTWEEESPQLRHDYTLYVDSSHAILRNPFSEKKWRKFQISRLFSGSNAATKLHIIDVNLWQGGTRVVDQWLVALSLGSGQTRNMALDRRYLAYNLTPVAGVAAHICRNAQPTEACWSSSLLCPLPLSGGINIPVTILGCFLVRHNRGRYLFKYQNIEALAEAQLDAGNHLIEAWNRELMSCVRDSYIEMVLEMQKLRREPLNSTLEFSLGHAVGVALNAYIDQYSFWPRSNGHMQINQSGDDGKLFPSNKLMADWECVIEQVIRPFYARLVDLPVWQLYSGNLVRAEEGMFLSQPRSDVRGNVLPATVCGFVKEHYPVFSVPWQLVTEIQAVGVVVREIKPKMVRDLLKVSSTSIILRSIDTFLDVLEYCLSDLQLDDESSSVQPDALSDNFSSDFMYNFGKEEGSSSGSVSIRELQKLHGMSTQSSASSKGDALEMMTSLGKALFDFGRVVVEDIGRAGGPLVLRNNVAGTSIDSVRRSGDQKLLLIAAELKGLPCPTAANHLIKLGFTEVWVGNKDQQALLSSVAAKFIHLKVLDRSILADILSNRSLQGLLKLQNFSLHLLANHMRLIFHEKWVNHVMCPNMAPWFSWESTASSGGEGGPSPEWIRLFWKNVTGSLEDLSLFADWPLIPAFLGRRVLCRVKERHLVFIPPSITDPDSVGAATEMGTSEGDLAELSSESESIHPFILGFEVAKNRYPWLLLLLNQCNIPIFDATFMDCAAPCNCLPAPGQSLGQVIVSKLAATKHAGYFPELTSFSAADCDELLILLASDFSSNESGYVREELEVLCDLPIFRTVIGSYTRLQTGDQCLISSNSFLKPNDEHCLSYSTDSMESLLLQALGVPVLHDQQIFIRFGLPGFEGKPQSEQEDILIYLYTNWDELQLDSSVVEALRETKFVRNAEESSEVLSKPKDLFDPDDVLLTSAFSGETKKFPGERFGTDGWLRILRKTGLRTASEADVILECARRVESLGCEFLKSRGVTDDFETDLSSSQDEVLLEIWLLAESVVKAIFSNFAVFYSSNFCDILGKIACIPAEKGFPDVGGKKGGKRVLCSYSEAILLKDWPLAWSCAPILSRQTVVPPEYSWGALHLRSPPVFSTVLKHLQAIGRNNGEDTLAHWPNTSGLMTIEEASLLVLKYLDKVWGSLSSSDIKELQRVAFMPAANGTRLVTASSLFARLTINLSPFAFELPSQYLPFVKILKEIGLQDMLSVACAKDLLSDLQRACGYQRLNPNELRAVMEILHFVCDKTIEVSDRSNWVSEAIVPDDGCRLVYAKLCVYVDSYGSHYIKYIDTSRLRLVNPDLPERICKILGIKKLSDVVVEELDHGQKLETLEQIGSVLLTSIRKRLLSKSFQAAVWDVVNSMNSEIADFDGLDLDKMQTSLMFVSEKLQFVQRLHTRFMLFPKSLDITRVAKELICPEWDDGSQHRRLYFVDRLNTCMLLAEPPSYISVLDVLAIVVSQVLGSPVPLPIGSLFICPEGFETAIVNFLRLHSEKGVAEGTGRKNEFLGKVILPQDAIQVQLHPLRPFYSGEVVAWRSQNGEKLKYGTVVEDARPSAGQALYRFKVEIAPGVIEPLLSSQVFSFKGVSIGNDTSSSTMLEDNHTVSESRMLAEKPEGSGRSKSKDVQSNTEHQYGQVSAAELVQAVHEMLSAAGINMDVEKQSLLQTTLSLQEQLKVSQAALLLEQEKSDAAAREAETAKAAWLCRVCLSNEVDNTMVPCGHVLCRRCSSAVSRCPFCRLQVSKTLRIFRP
ncbi:LOW QUALITY PROTEIN: uncharacterized protein LOC127809789 [Diospyros lotus]|uniref:LOW QUALITY PROTEIN: uncharacterized protein LOC127809789 n=1 Tax=Diospyros lotus TaxID=55363 RepID=UPI00224E95CE|nr:LOW QUALITY PROTEIN: uncharacterized protein LOC127809789 [Diospyros lotus]